MWSKCWLDFPLIWHHFALALDFFTDPTPTRPPPSFCSLKMKFTSFVLLEISHTDARAHVTWSNGDRTVTHRAHAQMMQPVMFLLGYVKKRQPRNMKTPKIRTLWILIFHLNPNPNPNLNPQVSFIVQNQRRQKPSHIHWQYVKDRISNYRKTAERHLIPFWDISQV